MSGISLSLLREAVRRLSQPLAEGSGRPIVGTLYEKGLIWGFNYNNTAAVASLGLLLWRAEQAAPLTGRCGGHQKGWAVATRPVPGFSTDTGKGYPFGNSTDVYTDERLTDLHSGGIDGWTSPRIPVHHNLDTHVFGPDELLEPERISGGTRVRLKNGVDTLSAPDVRLLWIVGGNYLGQTHAATWKRKRLRQRLAAGSTTGDAVRPERAADGGAPSEESIVEVLSKRIGDEDGLVVVHQDIFPNPTMELADLVLPAAGWGEDDFVRYNAERRLRLYEQIQDPPLHREDESAELDRELEHGPPENHVFKHSPKPDWVIFRDVANAMINVVLGEEGSDFRSGFEWSRTSEVADEMARDSHRSGMLGALLPFAATHDVAYGKRVHTVLGVRKGGEAPLLEEGYSVPEGSPVQGNGVATNGVLLPVRLADPDEGCKPTLVGSLRNVPAQSARLNFVRADWNEIEGWFESFAPKEGEVVLTCGRVNHLWNNLYNHVRNEYVSERYPEDLPGPILEVNPTWAERENLENGEIVDVENEDGRFVAVISRQDSLAGGAAFAIFSFPVRKNGHFNFDGYPNNLMNGYWDGINPIGALKYGRARVVSRTGKPKFASNRLGPSYGQRNRIVALPLTSDLRPGVEKAEQGLPARWKQERRLDWRMRELIVTKGLPRTYIHTGRSRQASILSPDVLFGYLRTRLRAVFPMMLAAMQWPQPWKSRPGRFDRWDGHDLTFARDEWGRSVAFDEDPDLTAPPPLEVDAATLERFVAWSVELTGFDDLDGDLALARSFHSRLRLHGPEIGQRLDTLLRSLEVRHGRLTKRSVRLARSDRGLAELATILWYTGTFIGQYGFADEGFGSMVQDHYRKALMWRAMRVQPPGYSTRMDRWWERPEEIS